MASKGTAGTADLKKGLVNRSVASVDASMKCKGKSVDDGATRDKPAKTPATLGPRKTG